MRYFVNMLTMSGIIVENFQLRHFINEEKQQLYLIIFHS